MTSSQFHPPHDPEGIVLEKRRPLEGGFYWVARARCGAWVGVQLAAIRKRRMSAAPALNIPPQTRPFDELTASAGYEEMLGRECGSPLPPGGSRQWSATEMSALPPPHDPEGIMLEKRRPLEGGLALFSLTG